MREILFRGKRVDNGEWVEGWLFKYMSSLCIGWEHGIECDYGDGGLKEHTYYFVIPETIGQFTGLYGADDRPIYEGDILMWDDGEWGCAHNELVMWDYELFAMRKRDWREWCIVIGNIHDNRELLEVGNG